MNGSLPQAQVLLVSSAVRWIKSGWESDSSQIGTVVVEVWDEPTRHTVNVQEIAGLVEATGEISAKKRGKKDCEHL